MSNIIPHLPDGKVKKYSDDLLIEIWNKIISDYDLYLKQYGVKMPKNLWDENQIPNKNSLALLFLYNNKLHLINKNQVSHFISLWYGEQYDTQVRHLATQSGWYILNKNDVFGNIKVPSGYHIFISSVEPNPKFIQATRSNRYSAKDFDELKKCYNDRCVCCGSVDGKPLLHDPLSITKLQQGHKDPSKSLDIDNVVPQCQYCNQHYKDAVVFNDKGRIIALNSIDLVSSSSLRVQKLILEWLSHNITK